MSVSETAETNTHPETISAFLTFIFAAACGLVVANLYYAQPLAGLIGASLGLNAGATGLIVTLSQIGYCLGLLLIVPLGDLLENRALIVTLVGATAVGLIIAALSSTPFLFLSASLLVGMSSVAVQVIVPFAAHLASHETRGRVVGNVMSGLLCGIMLARPVSSFIAEYSSWHAVYYFSATIMVVVAAVLRGILPARQPAGRLRYTQLLASMAHLLLNTPVLQRRAAYQACMFGAFSLFWTTTPLLLTGPAFHLSQNAVALFALAGAAGAIASPIAGRLADRGLTRIASLAAMTIAMISFVISYFAGNGSTLALAALTVSAVLLDFGVTTSLVCGQRAIYSLSGEHRSRLNGLFMAMFFLGGAAGSAIGGWSFAVGGWGLTAIIGFCLPATAFLFSLTERRRD